MVFHRATAIASSCGSHLCTNTTLAQAVPSSLWLNLFPTTGTKEGQVNTYGGQIHSQPPANTYTAPHTASLSFSDRCIWHKQISLLRHSHTENLSSTQIQSAPRQAHSRPHSLSKDRHAQPNSTSSSHTPCRTAIQGTPSCTETTNTSTSSPAHHMENTP